MDRQTWEIYLLLLIAQSDRDDREIEISPMRLQHLSPLLSGPAASSD
jgi:hypothetical protein